MKILQISDTHVFQDSSSRLLGVDTFQTFSEVINGAQQNGWPPDLIIMTGDISQDQTPESYHRVGAILNNVGVPVFCLPGNHDSFEFLKTHITQKNVQVEKWVDRENWRIIMLDSAKPQSHQGKLSESELQILQGALENTSADHILICFHHNPLPVNSAWLDSMTLENGGEFFQILDRSPKVRGVVFGHIHQEHSSKRKSVHMLGAPSTCVQFAPFSPQFKIDLLPPGYRWITLDADGNISSEVHRLANIPGNLDVNATGY